MNNRVLVVDESPFVRKLIRAELESAGIEVTEAEDGGTALARFQEARPNLVTLGVEMAGVDGFSVCERIRALGARKGGLTPVLFVTSNDNARDRERGFKVGASDFVTKPFAKGELLQRVRVILRGGDTELDAVALVADDSHLVRRIVADALNRLGVTVLEATDGEQALDLAREHWDNLDLVLTDLHMPNLSGSALTRAMRAEPKLAEIPIIVLSAESEKDAILQLFKEGATDYVTKPFSLEELLARVHVHLQARLLAKDLSRRNQEMRSDLELAREVQRGTLHDQVDVDHIQAAVVYRPFAEVSGDIYDFSAGADGNFRAFFGDATGHGVGAAFMTIMFQTGLDSLPEDIPEEEVLTRLHGLIYERTADQYVTGMIVRINVDGVTRYANAGHLPMVWLPAKGEPRLVGEDGGLPLGILEKTLPFCPGSIVLSPGDRLILMSDGILEWADSDGEQFGIQKLMTYLDKHREESLQAMLNGVVEAASEFAQKQPCLDDLSLVALQYR